MNFRERFLQKLPRDELSNIIREEIDVIDRFVADAKKERTIFLPSQRIIVDAVISTEIPAEPETGSMFYNMVDCQFHVYNGSRWYVVPESQLTMVASEEAFNNKRLTVNKTTIPLIREFRPRAVTELVPAHNYDQFEHLMDLAAKRMVNDIDEKIIKHLACAVEKEVSNMLSQEQTTLTMETLVKSYNKAKEVLNV